MTSETLGEKKVAIVSGAAGYLGQAIVHALIEAGFVVAGLYRETPLKPMGNLHAFKCDLKDEREVASIFKEIETKLGKPYAVIHAAGMMPAAIQLMNSTEKDLQKEFENNIFTSFNFLNSGARSLKDSKKGILVGVTTANVATFQNTKARGLYSPSKYALQGMLVSLREELSPYGVQVYSVAPGAMMGGMNRNIPKAFLDIARSRGRSGELTSPEKVAEVIADLAIGKRKSSELTILIAPETE